MAKIISFTQKKGDSSKNEEINSFFNGFTTGPFVAYAIAGSRRR